MAAERAVVVGVVAGRGGGGASTLAALLARAFSRRTATVLVDLDPSAAGIDLLVGLEEADGVRWPDLLGAGEDVPGADVLALLPRWGSCAVLSADRSRPAVLDPTVVADVLHALASAVGVLVLDLDRGAVTGGGAVGYGCDEVLIVAPRDLRTVAGVLAMRPGLLEWGADVGLALRGPAPGGLAADDVARAVGLPVRGVLPYDRGLAAAVERAGLPRTGRLVRAVQRIADSSQAGAGR